MGTLSEPVSGRRITLGPRMLVGRAPSCAIRLDDPLVSGEHATICYRAEGWELRDLGSRNGTWVDADKVPRGGRARLVTGSVVAFGSTKLVWYLVDDGPPVAQAREVGTERVVHAEGGLLVLPDEENPEATIYEEDHAWVMDSQAGPQNVADQFVVTVGMGRWILELPRGGDVLAETTMGTTRRWQKLSAVGIRFDVSLDQEHVQVTLLSEEPDRKLPPRAYHNLLLVLARQRLKDRAAGVPEPECGWLYGDDLAKMLAEEPSKINVDVFRARQQLQKLGIAEAQNLVERRTTTRQVRVGLEWLEIVEGQE
jgi:hypothetical protein